MKPYLLPRTKCVTMDDYPLSVFFCLICPPLISKGRLNNMSEAIISRRGWGPEGKPAPVTLRTELIQTNQNWIVPNHKGTISVRIFGGGSGSYNGRDGYGGGGGWMNNGEFTLSNGGSVKITIGAGGDVGKSGGTTSFASYLSANGGSGLDGGSGGSTGGSGSENGGIGYQFGGGWGFQNGGNGGTWGGGGGSERGNGGKGGMYGGGGGTSEDGYIGGLGGIYGGNGGNQNTNSENGTNTIGLSSVPSNCRGYGIGNTLYGGGGGYGGNGGIGSRYFGAGGGGYGGNGGSGSGGGGGGYGKGADGGNGSGGGGGYFSKGGDGGYGGGGGGGYGNGGSGIKYDGEDGGIGAGGGCGRNGGGRGGSGICIIQYYA